jgi:hypothetical protein
MSTYYEEVMRFWQEGEFFEAISCFSGWLSEILVSESEIEDFSKNLSAFWRLIEVECELNPKVTFSLYEMVEKARYWDGEHYARD